MDFETIVPIINLLPPQVQLFLLNLSAGLLMVWLLLYSMRLALYKTMGPPSASDTPRKLQIFHWFKWLDFFTPEQIQSALEIVRKEKVIRTLALSVPPPGAVIALPPPKVATFPPPAPADAGHE
jgi:hypothetical protein